MGSSQTSLRPGLHEEIRHRLDSVPDAPWLAGVRDDAGPVVGMVTTASGWGLVVDATAETDVDIPIATFIAHAPADIRALLAEADRLRAQVDAAYAFAEEMGDYCSPHGVATRYAQTLRERLDDAPTGKR